jgi:ribosomal protein L37AE/L43A
MDKFNFGKLRALASGQKLDEAKTKYRAVEDYEKNDGTWHVLDDKDNQDSRGMPEFEAKERAEYLNTGIRKERPVSAPVKRVKPGVVKEGVSDAEDVFNRLEGIAKNGIDARDAENIKKDIATKLKQGWTATEIVSYVRWTEEINPDIEEDDALAKMKRVKTVVQDRLGKKVDEAKADEPEKKMSCPGCTKNGKKLFSKFTVNAGAWSCADCGWVKEMTKTEKKSLKESALNEATHETSLADDDTTGKSPEQTAQWLAKKFKVQVKLIDANPKHSGGWPIYAFTGSDEAIKKLTTYIGEQDLNESTKETKMNESINKARALAGLPPMKLVEAAPVMEAGDAAILAKVKEIGNGGYMDQIIVRAVKQRLESGKESGFEHPAIVQADKVIKALGLKVKVAEAVVTEGTAGNFLNSGVGQAGAILVLDDNAVVKKLAKVLGIADGWQLKDIGNGLHAAYNSGDRLSLFTNAGDFESDEDIG